MARKKAKATVETAAATPQTLPPPEPAAVPEELVDEPPRFTADPHPKITVSLSGRRGGPAVHLLRSQKFHQMQIRFDAGQPGEEYLAMLASAGWKDRTEAEGVWTKQIDRDARWQSVAKMEQEFRDVANAIRKDRGLEPALGGRALA
jgi:hypothetical protein